ncbi:hypothetical protein [Paraburkholderia phenoliruptrix]|uniref:hypothetical protein n=1 Tax=Paraburkholderia phenoliruptrix TaxID=252970 RepID=UPI0028567135|nr:hypothetical protein [Paraburkholderia phenoliruptrix]MDR6393331.1 hypothetical protein [Paraburkholderia phenoliruptrix]
MPTIDALSREAPWKSMAEACFMENLTAILSDGITGAHTMKFNDTHPVMTPADSPPLWLASLSETATLEATVLKRPIEGRADILSVIKHAVSLYEFQQHSYKGMIGDGLYMESYRSQIEGVPIETVVLAHRDERGATDSVVINHRPLNAVLLFSKLMWERVDERFRDCYLTGPEIAALDKVQPVSPTK